MTELRRVCAWCASPDRTAEDPDVVLTHGICDQHREEFLRRVDDDPPAGGFTRPAAHD
jgi:predicted alpha/beta-fold hydrolase